MQQGDILVSSWGYEQTNINFYKVLKRSSSFATIIEIGRKINVTGAMTYDAYPDETLLIGTPIKRKIKNFTAGCPEDSDLIEINDYVNAYMYTGGGVSGSYYH